MDTRQVLVKGTKMDSGWYKVQYPDVEGFEVVWIEDSFVTRFVGDDRGPLLDELLEEGAVLTPVEILTQEELHARHVESYNRGFANAYPPYVEL